MAHAEICRAIAACDRTYPLHLLSRYPDGADQLRTHGPESRFEFEVTGKPDIKNGKGAPERGQLYIDNQLVGQVDIPLTMPLSIGLGGGIVCGADMGSPVWDKYQPPFRSTGKLHSTIIDVSGDLIRMRSRNANGDGTTVSPLSDRGV